jgi:hypothetical protein
MNGAPAGAEANAGADPVHEGFAVNQRALAAWMTANVPGIEGPLQRRVARGQTASAHAAKRAQAYPRLVQLALKAMEACR